MARIDLRILSVVLVLAACGEEREPGRMKEAQDLVPETEPNGTVPEAMPIVGTNVVMTGNIAPNNDADFYSFSGNVGDKVYAATQTAFTSSGSGDSVLTLLGPDGVTVIETDDENGALNGNASVIAGTVLPATGTYYLKVAQFFTTSQIRPYQLHFQIRSGTPTLEGAEPNDGIPQPLGPWIDGSLAATTDVDFYQINLNAGDTLFAALDLDPDRDGVQANGVLGIGPFDNFLLLINDSGAEAGPDAEAEFITAKAAGTYLVRVTATAGLGPYQLSLSVHPAAVRPGCTTYTSTPGLAIPTGPGLVTSTISVPDDVVIDDIDVSVNLNHTGMADLDAHLIAPGGNDVGLFTDVGAGTTSPNMDVTLDDEAGIPISTFTVVAGMVSQPKLAYRLGWFRGERAQGTWTLSLWDDTAVNGGTLNSWSITICPRPAQPITCPAGRVPATIYTTDFEIDDAGFTHSGAADQWARGMPTAAPITTCNGGAACFKTNLAGTYALSSNQDLLSPAINLTAVTAPIRVTWAQKYQMQTANNDHAFVAVRQAGGANPRRLWEFMDGTMTDSVGNPATVIQESAGWGAQSADISGYAGMNAELQFHLDSDTALNLAGLAIDDVAVIGCVVACGNGALDAGEACDDGNPTNGDGCDSNCTVSACGNGIMAGTEACDDSNLIDDDGCDSNCTLTACGNGVRAGGEGCDDGNLMDDDGCDSNCTVTNCGNGIKAGAEQCDDGNTMSGDGCDSNCTPTGCGNGVATGTEACDDANAIDDDGCDSNCTITACGNGVKAGAEACDDANLIDDDGCDSNCTATGCGNNIMTSGEACDDGNAAEGDGCDSNCTVSACGNGIRAGLEVCDDSNTTGGDGCSADCMSDETCGNGVLDPGEQCDDSATAGGDGCSATCIREECGNDIDDPGEQCDDGNTAGGDGCSDLCNREECGNDIVDPGEVCDDGNIIGGDGCSANCLSAENCGNNIVDLGEACDDGNNTSGDGCSATCASNESCGNDVVNPGETCDDGNTTAGDGCSANCLSNETCGNDVVDSGEACDDGNLNSGDGCSANCSSNEACGNGVLDPGETCDDGNTTAGDGCSADCRSNETCANGVVDSGEACDDGNSTSGDGCSADCSSSEACGNAFVDPGETCDDGNTADGDGCSADCGSDESCGNDVVDSSEECDDGNTTSGDGCEADCTLPTGLTCGDNMVTGFEECDDGNSVSGDGCSSTCHAENGDSGGCDCQVGAPGSGSPAALLFGLAVPAVVFWHRRRKARRD